MYIIGLYNRLIYKESRRYIKFVQNLLGQTIGNNLLSLVKYKSTKTIWAIFIGIVKIDSGTAQMLGFKKIAARGGKFKKCYPPEFYLEL